jgi:hypothetical protein
MFIVWILTVMIVSAYNEEKEKVRERTNKKKRNGDTTMLNKITYHILALSFFLFFVWSVVPSTVFAEELTGGITFTGDRAGVCVLIEGEFIKESIYFKLDTCDDNQEVKEQFKYRTPFTILVPEGEQRLVIMKEGQKVVTDTITIKPGEILEYKLP